MPLFKYWLSRIAFVNTHAVFAYWLLFVTNDPLNFGGVVNTLDAKSVRGEGQCTAFDVEKAIWNTIYFVLVWWVPHSGLARNKVKALFGSSPEHPLDRPVFAFIAPFGWLATLLLWQPVSDCSKLDVTQIDLLYFAPRLIVILVFLVELLGLFYLLGDHVFGLDRYTWVKKPPAAHDLIVAFPYALVRHPAAAAFIFFYWLIPSYNANHLLLAVQWTIFIVLGTAWEEAGLTREFAQDKLYLKYRSKVNAFIPSVWSVKKSLGLLSREEDWDAIKDKSL